MAQRVVTTVTDDIDGSTNDVATVTFALDGVQYDIDLNPANAESLRGALKPFIDHARKTGGKQGKAPLRSVGTSHAPGRPATNGHRPKQNLTEVRAWLKSNGHEVSDRGRIPLNLMEVFGKGHAPARAATEHAAPSLASVPKPSAVKAVQEAPKAPEDAPAPKPKRAPVKRATTKRGTSV